MPTPELLIPHNFSYFTKDLFTFSQQNWQCLVGVVVMAVTLHVKGLGFKTNLRCLFYFNLLVKYENLWGIRSSGVGIARLPEEAWTTTILGYTSHSRLQFPSLTHGWVYELLKINLLAFVKQRAYRLTFHFRFGHIAHPTGNPWLSEVRLHDSQVKSTLKYQLSEQYKSQISWCKSCRGLL